MDLFTKSEHHSKLLETLYPEIKRLAAIQMSRERSNHTLCPTALVNEAYLKMSSEESMVFNDKQHFLAVCGNCVRQILVSHARTKNAAKRGGGQVPVTLIEGVDDFQAETDMDVLLLDELLTRLQTLDEVQVKVVELRFFSGMSNEEISDVLEISLSTVKRKWTMAKAWLYKEMNR